MGASLPSGLIIDTERTGWTESCHGGSPLVGGWAPGLRNAAILGGCCTRPLVGLGGLGGRGGRPGACPLRRASASCRRSPLLLRWWDSVTTRMRLQTQTTGMGAPRARKGIRTCELPCLLVEETKASKMFFFFFLMLLFSLSYEGEKPNGL